MSSAPCKDCPERRVGCHGDCRKYRAYQAERIKLRNKSLDRLDVEDFKIKTIRRTKKKLSHR